MARKKNKAAKPSANRPTTGARSRGGFPPFPPPACESPVWRHLWTLLAAGFALRLLAGLSGDWIYREDEVMQYLEPAHRMLFGSGFLTWEQRYGVRNLLTAAPAAGLMTLCDAAGRGPDCYIPALAILNALLSMAIPASLYFIARRVYDETAGRAALIVSCFWYTFVVFAPRLMIEETSAILLLSGLALTPPLARSGWALVRRESGDESVVDISVPRLWAIGFLIGLAGFVRLQYIPVAGALGLLLLFRLPPRLAPHLAAGAVVAFVLTGAADWVVWGRFYHSVFAYLDSSQFFDQMFDRDAADSRWYAHIVRLTVCSAGLWPLVFLAAATDWRRHWLPLGAVVVVLVVHGLAISASYSHIFLALPFLTLALGGVVSRPPEFLRGALRGGGKLVAAGIAGLLSLGGAAHVLPNQTDEFWVNPPPIPAGESRRFFFQDNPLLAAARFLSRVPPEQMRAVLWTSHGPPWTGGYFYLHHHVPNWHFGLESHNPLLRGRAPAEIASHIAAWDPGGAQWALDAGFKEIANFGGTRVFENPNLEKVQMPEKFPLGFGNNLDAAIDRETARLGREVPPAAFLPLQ